MKRLNGNRLRSTSKQMARGAALGIEQLEDRQMMSVNPLTPILAVNPGTAQTGLMSTTNPSTLNTNTTGGTQLPWQSIVVDDPSHPGAYVQAGVLVIQGSNGNDSASVSLVPTRTGYQLQVSRVGTPAPTYVPGVGVLPGVTVHYPAQLFDPTQVTQIEFFGDAGNDSFTNATAVPCSAFGTGSDHFVGGSGNDYLQGGTGPNLIEGGGGNDTFVAGAGDNTFVFANNDLGSVNITGAANGRHNTLDFSKFAPSGISIDLGNTARQTVHSPARGVVDLQLTLAMPGVVQEVHGTPFADYIKAGAGDCTFEGEGGNDTFVAGSANNTFLFAGNDLGSVTIQGTANGYQNTLDFSQFGPSGITLDVGKTTKQTVHSSNGAADLQLTLSSGAFINEVQGSPYADVIRANDASDIIHGNGGNDTIYGGRGVDHLYADTGNATLYAGVQGSPSYFYGGSGNSVIVTIGGSGHDTVSSGTGWASLWVDSTDTLSYNPVLDTMHHVHRVDQYFACSYNGGLTNVGSPSLQRNGVAGAEPNDSNLQLADFSGNPLFSSTGPSPDDVVQGNTADCYLMSFLSSLARTDPDRIRQYVVDLGDGTYAVNFQDQNHKDAFVRVDGKLPSDGGGNLTQANFGKENSIWVGIIEKAWTFYRMANATAINGKVTFSGSYASINNSPKPGQISLGDAFAVKETQYNVGQFASATDYVNAISAALKNSQAVEITGPYVTQNQPWSDSTPQTLANYHSILHGFSVVQVIVDSNGTAMLQIRDPYATNTQSGPTQDGYVWISAATAFFGSPNFTTYDPFQPNSYHALERCGSVAASARRRCLAGCTGSLRRPHGPGEGGPALVGQRHDHRQRQSFPGDAQSPKASRHVSAAVAPHLSPSIRWITISLDLCSVRLGGAAAKPDQAPSHVHDRQNQSGQGAQVSRGVEMADDHEGPKILDAEGLSPVPPRAEVVVMGHRYPQHRAGEAGDWGHDQDDREGSDGTRPPLRRRQFGQAQPRKEPAGEQAGPPGGEEADLGREQPGRPAEVRVGELAKLQLGEILRGDRVADLVVQRTVAARDHRPQQRDPNHRG